VSRSEILSRLSSALLSGDRATARSIYYDWVVPNRAFSNREAERLSYRLGAIDEGDAYLAGRTDL
jgi:hypothetical protein